MTNKSTNVRAQSYRPKSAPLLGRVSQWSPELAGWLGLHWFTQPRHWPRPAPETELLAKATRLNLSHGVAAWSWGSGPLCILVHGWEGRGAQLGSFVQPLVERGYRVATFDAQAHGSSTGSHATLLSWLAPIAELTSRFGEPAAVIAHSFGCPAVNLALRRGLQTNCLVYIAPPDAIDVGAKTFARVTGIGAQGEVALRRRVSAVTGLRFEEQRVEAFGREMTTPLLVLHDEQDSDVSLKCARTYARHWPDCTVVTTQGLGHRQILRDANVVARAVAHIDAHRNHARLLDRWLMQARERSLDAEAH